LGFSLNNLTLFGLVLAIGIVVDDAIVVVEAVEHHIERGMGPREATVRAMDEVSGPVVAIGLVLSAVFVPCAFISGIIGQFFRQFALTIASSTLISTFNSLTLSPALAALLLRSRVKGKYEALPRLAFVALGGWLGWQYLGPWLAPHLESTLAASVQGARVAAPAASSWVGGAMGLAVGMGLGWLMSRPLNRLFGGFFWLFNLGFKIATHLYTRIVGLMLRVGAIVLLVYGGLLYLTYWGFINTPTGFIPSQDMGYLLVNVQLPDASSAERTQEVMERLQKIALKQPGIKHTVSTAGQSFLLSAFGSNFGSMFIILDDFAKRRAPELYGDAIASNLRKVFSQVTDAQVAIFPPPPVRGVGRAGGFKIMIEDRSDAGPSTLQGQTDNLVEVGNKATLLDKGDQETPALVGLSSVFRANVPQLFADVDRTECMSKDVALRDLFETLQVYLGSLYVNDFNRFGRTWQVIVQADPRFRNKIEDVRRLKVRNSDGLMVPLGSLASVREINGPLILTRYNMYPASFINGNAAKGVSSGQAIAVMEQLAQKELLSSMTTEWTELSYLELQAGNTAMIVFGFA
ncbi:MAG TPA: efflux RND transporter permease subunit, partial [Isosphaeraceae bacterium]|nr:efflux RND transporter permease subunit [Isosphaeraceae bacterium]